MSIDWQTKIFKKSLVYFSFSSQDCVPYYSRMCLFVVKSVSVSSQACVRFLSGVSATILNAPPCLATAKQNCYLGMPTKMIRLYLYGKSFFFIIINVFATEIAMEAPSQQLTVIVLSMNPQGS